LPENKYLHHDQLGNVVRITDAAGVVKEKLDFAPFGDRRNVNDPRQTFIQAGQVSNGTLTLASNLIINLYATKRGFTGHEMVDGMDIIHMNGRIYDNMIGRFLQADPIIQEPSNTQNFNRYTYVWNNPLAYTDPSGLFSIGKLFGNLAMFFKVLSFIPGLQFFAVVSQVFSVAAKVASIATAFRYGGAKGGLLTAFMPTFDTGRFFIDALANSITAGINSIAMGGKFKDGAVGALKSAAISFVITSIGEGVKSAQTGGKMGSGNEDQELHAPDSGKPKPQTKTHIRTAKEIADFNKLKAQLEGVKDYKTEQNAQDAFEALAVPFTNKYGVEVGANLTKIGKAWGIADVTLGVPSTVSIPINDFSVAMYHTHPIDSGIGFSGSYRRVSGERHIDGGDISVAMNRGQPIYAFGGPDRAVWYFDQAKFLNDYGDAKKSGKDIWSAWPKYSRRIK
jgi:RHS repeat-associated protein